MKKKLFILNTKIGSKTSTLFLALALITFAIVVFRYVFRESWIWLQELALYFHATIFLLGSAWGFYRGAHVRVDVIFTRLSESKKTLVNKWGGLLLLMPSSATIFILSFPYVVDSWTVMEGSTDGSGLHLVFLLKTMILVFSATSFIVGLQMFLYHQEFIEKSSSVSECDNRVV